MNSLHVTVTITRYQGKIDSSDMHSWYFTVQWPWGMESRVVYTDTRMKYFVLRAIKQSVLRAYRQELTKPTTFETAPRWCKPNMKLVVKVKP